MNPDQAYWKVDIEYHYLFYSLHGSERNYGLNP